MLHLSTIDKNTHLLLQDLFNITFIKNNFALAGGTSLALQTGHRKSIDLDFFSIHEFNIKELEIILSSSKIFKFLYTGNNSRMLFSFINNIKCDFIHEPASLLNPFEVIDGINFFSIADIAAMKLHTICGRGKKKDFFDVYTLLQRFDWDTLIGWFIRKYDEKQVFFLWRSILYFEDAENDPDINGLPPYHKNWNEIKDYLVKTCS